MLNPLEKFHELQPKPRTFWELKIVLEFMWEDLLKEPIKKAIKALQGDAEHMWEILMVDKLNTCLDALTSLFSIIWDATESIDFRYVMM